MYHLLLILRWLLGGSWSVPGVMRATTDGTAGRRDSRPGSWRMAVRRAGSVLGLVRNASRLTIDPREVRLSLSRLRPNAAWRLAEQRSAGPRRAVAGSADLERTLACAGWQS